MTTRHPTIQTSHPRQGLTLIEIMVALTMTLIVLGAMMQAFKYASDEMSKGRAMMEGSNQIRAAEDILRRDLSNITVDPRPYLHAEPPGYFEYVEGPRYDNTSGAGNNSYLGDVDDILAMTVRSEERPFRGRFVDGAGQVQVIESAIAEVIWFTVHNDRGNGAAGTAPVIDFDESVTLYRRVLLIRPDLNDGTGVLPGGATTAEFYSKNDISTRVNGAGAVVANSLSDLAHRANRFCHASGVGSFPHFINRGLLTQRRIADADPSLAALSYTGDDIILNDLCAFDVRAYSPNANVNVLNGSTRFLEQGDVGYQDTPTTTAITVSSKGGFIDIGNQSNLAGIGAVNQGYFSGKPANPPGIPAANRILENEFETVDMANDFPDTMVDRFFDTWTPKYEYDGVNQDVSASDTTADEGTNGLDDDNSNGVDDTNERETAPPYDVPLRGLKITLRVIEKNSKQMRQSSIVHSFVPQ